jgi:hypothetical protein
MLLSTIVKNTHFLIRRQSDNTFGSENLKYVLSLETRSPGTFENLEEAKKGIIELVQRIKPEAMYFSTIRRLVLIVANIEDPHVELRQIFETLSVWGNVTVDPVSTFEEFGAFMESM